MDELEPRQPGEITSEDKTTAMLGHVIGCVVSFVGPLVIWVIKKDESPFVAYHAMQATVYHALALVISMAVITVTCGLGSPILLLFWAGAIWVGLKANNGEWQGYPGLSSIGRPPGV